MKITKAWLKKWSACKNGVDWFAAQKESDGLKVCEKLLTEKHLDWANWLIARLLSRKDRLRYAVYAAEQVIELYERKYPNDKRPRKAIEAAKRCIDHNTKANREAAAREAAAAEAAREAAWAEAWAWAAAGAAAAVATWAREAVAAEAAVAAARAAAEAEAARAAEWAAAVATEAESEAWERATEAATRDEMKTKIIRYGMELYRGEGGEEKCS